MHSPTLGIDTTLPRIDLRLRVNGDRLRVGVRAWAQAEALPLTAVLDVDRTRQRRGLAGRRSGRFPCLVSAVGYRRVRLREGRANSTCG